MIDFLRKVPLFAELPEEDLRKLCEMVEVVSLPSGAELFREGDPGDRAYVIRKGWIEVHKVSAGRPVLLAVRRVGEVIGELALLEDAPRMAGARAAADSELIAIGRRQLDSLLSLSPSAARAMLHTVAGRLRDTEIMLRQGEKMVQLGGLTAGIAHELNNPASAALRGSEQLRPLIARWQAACQKAGRTALSPAQSVALEDLLRRAAEPAEPADLEPLARSDREEAVEEWLEGQGLDAALPLAGELAALGYGIEPLEELRRTFPSEALPATLELLSVTRTIYELLGEITHGAAQITAIVQALRTYVYHDQAPVQEVDLHEGLESTLIILHSRLKEGIRVHREYAAHLPRIQAYGSELNQVWTNLIHNAADAMEGRGDLTLRTRADGSWVTVEVEDNGAGIPEEVKPRLFEPFFTTKPVGKGTGLGLNITYKIVQKHAGDIRVRSRPGRTTFEVRLPVDFEKVKDGSRPLPAFAGPEDERIREILASVKDIAVVGGSDERGEPCREVPAYLAQHGYRIHPGGADLAAVSPPVDLVLVFEGADDAAVTAAAARLGARVIWFQQPTDERTREIAREAGLALVADRCMRAEHLRLMSDPAPERPLTMADDPTAYTEG